MLVSGIILALYFWGALFGGPLISGVLFVGDVSAVAAGVAFVVAVASYLWTPRTMLFQTAFVSYAILMAVVALLVIDTGNLSSPFIALWMMAALFSPVFGWYGVGLVGALFAAFLWWLWQSNELGTGSLIVGTLVTVVPLLVGVLSWRSSGQTETEEDRSYHELASELNTVSGKAEIVIAAIADGVLALDAKGTIQLINPAAQQLLGWGKNDAVGLDYKSVLKLVDTRDTPVNLANDPVRISLETNKQSHIENYSLLTADTNKKFLASITVSPVGSMGSGAIVVFRDITSEKAEEREQAEFISTASHEMRTPVASIEGYLGLALNPQTAQIDDKAREYIGKAQEAAGHLGRLFQDLLDVSKADDGRLSNNPRVVDVVPFLGDIIQGLLPKAVEKQLHVTYKPDPDFSNSGEGDSERGERTLSQVLYVNVDNDHLREVLANLVENAIKYTPVGDVTIDAQGDETHVTITVTDSGIGIPGEDIPHLFQKFYRVDNTETREIGGTGLGLYLCRKLTEAMGGKIWVESQYQRGSSFYVRFPRLDHAEAKQLIEQPAIQPAQPLAQIQAVKAPQPLAPEPVQPNPAAVPSPQPTSPPIQQPPANIPPQPTTDGRPPVEAMGPQPVQQAQPQQPAPQPQRANQAPVYTPGARPNTPLSSIESNPRQYVQQRPAPGQQQPGNWAR